MTPTRADPMTREERAERRRELAAAVAGSESPKDVAQRYGVTQRTVTKALRENGIRVRELPGFPFPRHCQSKPTGRNMAEAVRLRRKGWSSGAIADFLGVTRERVRQLLKAGMPEYRGRADIGIDRILGSRPRVYQPGELFHGRVVVRDEGKRIVLRCPCGAEMSRNRYVKFRNPTCNLCKRHVDDAAVIRDYDAGLSWSEIMARNSISKAMVRHVLCRNARRPGDRTKGRVWSPTDVRWQRIRNETLSNGERHD